VIVLVAETLAVRWVLDRPPLSREQLLEEVTALVGGYLATGTR
jgi:hypothetical protein